MSLTDSGTQVGSRALHLHLELGANATLTRISAALADLATVVDVATLLGRGSGPDRASDFARDFARDLTSDRNLARDLDRDLGEANLPRSRTSALALARGLDSARALASDLASTIASDLALALARDIALAHTLAHDLPGTLDSDLDSASALARDLASTLDSALALARDLGAAVSPRVVAVYELRYRNPLDVVLATVQELGSDAALGVPVLVFLRWLLPFARDWKASQQRGRAAAREATAAAELAEQQTLLARALVDAIVTGKASGTDGIQLEAEQINKILEPALAPLLRIASYDPTAEEIDLDNPPT
jgi:hypothetical protein